MGNTELLVGNTGVLAGNYITIMYIRGRNPLVCAELAKGKEQDATVKPDLLYFASG